VMACPKVLRKSTAVDSPGSLVPSSLVGWLGWERLRARGGGLIFNRAPALPRHYGPGEFAEEPLPGLCASAGRPEAAELAALVLYGAIAIAVAPPGKNCHCKKRPLLKLPCPCSGLENCLT
jgi:hypothetical protein